MRKSILAAPIVLAGFFSAIAFAQNMLVDPNTTEPQHVRPGLYQVQAGHSGLCVAGGINGGGPRVPYFEQTDCNLTDTPDGVFGAIALVPRSGGYYLVSMGARRQGGGDHDYMGCATVARGVVFGPPAIDNRLCEFKLDFSTDDQIFPVAVTESRPGEIVASLRTINGECVTVRDDSRNRGAELIQAPCRGSASQMFRLRYLRPFGSYQPFSGSITLPNLERIERVTGGFDWHPGPGSADLSVHVEMRSGRDLQGSVYSQSVLAAPNCAAACAADRQCEGVTFISNGSAPLPDQPQCLLKTKVDGFVPAESWVHSGIPSPR